MLFHASISADDPKKVADVIAELWQGEALPFPFLGEGSWTAFAGDDRNSAIEVLPRGVELVPADGDADALAIANPNVSRGTPVHLAIATALNEQQVFNIGQREGWLTKYRKRGDAFGVIELWVDNAMMIEVLTPEMQREYLEVMTIEGYKSHLELALPSQTELQAEQNVSA